MKEQDDIKLQIAELVPWINKLALEPSKPNKNQWKYVKKAAAEFHAADFADLIEQLNPEARSITIKHLGGAIDPEILSYLDEYVAESLVDEIDNSKLSTIIDSLESDDAINLLESIENEEQQKKLLDKLTTQKRNFLEKGLSYPEGTAGRLMRSEFVSIPETWNVGQAIDYLREIPSSIDKNNHSFPTDFYNINLINNELKIIGFVKLSELITTNRSTKLKSIISDGYRTINANSDQKDVSYLFKQYGFTELPVVDDDQNILGTITIDDIVEIIEEVQESELLNLSGLNNYDFYKNVISTTWHRFIWLFVNLLTAVLASFVIFQFEASISKIVALAVLMPIVASMGGNSGTQTLTITVRALATGQLTSGNAKRSTIKEMIVAIINGFIFAFLTAAFTLYWFDSAGLAVVIAVAMIFNLFTAAILGIAVPLILKRVKLDPAVGSSVILTTFTDCFGFLAFLGLAEVFII